MFQWVKFFGVKSDPFIATSGVPQEVHLSIVLLHLNRKICNLKMWFENFTKLLVPNDKFGEICDSVTSVYDFKTPRKNILK